MAVGDDLEQQRAALTMIHAAPFNAEAPPEGLDGDITPTALHYVRSNFPVPDSRRHARDRRRGREPPHAHGRRPPSTTASRARRHARMRRERSTRDEAAASG